MASEDSLLIGFTTYGGTVTAATSGARLGRAIGVIVAVGLAGAEDFFDDEPCFDDAESAGQAVQRRAGGESGAGGDEENAAARGKVVCRTVECSRQ